MNCFVDTSVLFANASDRDGRHRRAHEILNGLTSTIVSDHVVVETWTLLSRRYGRAIAMRFWEGLLHTPIMVEQTTPSDLERALSIATQWPDQSFSIVDCTSFAVMERLGLRQVASFDDDFAIYRTGPDRTIAFDVLR